MQDNKQVSLEDVLIARENRLEQQRRLIKKHGFSLVSYTLNIAGPVKRFPLGDRCFFAGKQEIEYSLQFMKAKIAECIFIDSDTGLECIWAVNADALTLKSVFSELEESHPLGRLFDIDIITNEGEKIPRSAVFLSERGCFICGSSGSGCARNRTHSNEELFSYIYSTISDYFIQKDVQVIAKNAVRAMLYELSASPKPGLVDRYNSGAHSDMDFFTFIDSSLALYPYFTDMAMMGAAHRSEAAQTLLIKLRRRGLLAENEMFEASGGVNTYKGLVFSLGIICAACGYLGLPLTAERIFHVSSEIAAPALASDLKDVTQQNAATSGEKVYVKYGITGIRGEAAAGFPSVRQWGLPEFNSAIKRGCSPGDAGIIALLHLLANVCDTNVIKRAGREELNNIQKELKSFLAANPNDNDILEYSANLDRQFISKNISPGGCSDLLALTYMIFFMEETV